jgi:uncharacterized protein
MRAAELGGVTFRSSAVALGATASADPATRAVRSGSAPARLALGAWLQATSNANSKTTTEAGTMKERMEAICLTTVALTASGPQLFQHLTQNTSLNTGLYAKRVTHMVDLRTHDDQTRADSLTCISCGTCCFSTLPDYVQVTGNDYARLGELAAGAVHFSGIHAYMNMNAGHCAALLLEPGSGAMTCSVYALRPAICRELGCGSDECAAEIHAKGERPAAALLTLLGKPRSTPQS